MLLQFRQMGATQRHVSSTRVQHADPVLRSIELPTRATCTVHVCMRVCDFSYFRRQDTVSARWLQRKSLTAPQLQAVDEFLQTNGVEYNVDPEALCFSLLPTDEFKTRLASSRPGFKPAEIDDLEKDVGLYIQHGHVRGSPLFKQHCTANTSDCANVHEFWCSAIHGEGWACA